MDILDSIIVIRIILGYPSVDYQALNDIVIKLVRLASTPRHIDSWTDASLYSKLNVERLGGKI